MRAGGRLVGGAAGGKLAVPGDLLCPPASCETKAIAGDVAHGPICAVFSALSTSHLHPCPPRRPETAEEKALRQEITNLQVRTAAALRQ